MYASLVEKEGRIIYPKDQKKIKNLIAIVILFILSYQLAAKNEKQVFRLAKLEIDSTKLKAYNAALRLKIETFVRIELGVLLLNAVAEKDCPSHIVIMEVYAN